MTITKPQPNQQAQQTDAEDRAEEKRLADFRMNPLQQFISAMLLMFVRDESDADVGADKDSGRDNFLAELLGLKNGDEVRTLRQDLRDPKKDAQSSFDYSRMSWSKAGRFVASTVLPPIGAGAMTGNANFDSAVRKVLKSEGGLNLHEPDGAIANFGFNSKANPGLDVRHLTVNDAIGLYKTRYWDQIGGIDKMSQAQALVAFDCAVNCGVGKANEMVRKSGGDVNNMLEWRRNYYTTLASQNPSRNGEYLHTWLGRVNGLADDISKMSKPTVAFAAAGGKPDTAPGTQAASQPATQSLWQEAKASITQHLGLNA